MTARFARSSTPAANVTSFTQGYDVAHGMLICRLCGNRYPIDHMTRGEASCVPVSLPHHDDASAVEVKVSDLKSGAALF